MTRQTQRSGTDRTRQSQIHHDWHDYQFVAVGPGEWVSYCNKCRFRTERVSDLSQLLAKKLAAPPCRGDTSDHIAKEKVALLDELEGLAICSECKADDTRVLQFDRAVICLCDRCIADAMRVRSTATDPEYEERSCDQCKVPPPLPPLRFVYDHPARSFPTTICDTCLADALITRLSEVRSVVQSARNGTSEGRDERGHMELEGVNR